MKHGLVKDWTTKAGLRAAIYMTSLGHHCGYVAVEKGHPLHGVSYSAPCDALAPVSDDEPMGKRGVFTALSVSMSDDNRRAPEAVFNVHGGLTYSDTSKTYPAPSDGSLWWFGYDCGHSGDGPSPEHDQEPAWSYSGDFRDEDYCIAECESLAAQIVAATQKASA